MELTSTNRSCGLTVLLRLALIFAPRIRVAMAIHQSTLGQRKNDLRSWRAPGAAGARWKGCTPHGAQSGASVTRYRFPVVFSKRPHPIPSRTRKLSSSEPMVLHGKPCGRVGRCRDLFPKPRIDKTVRGFFFFVAGMPIRSMLAVRAHATPRGALEFTHLGCVSLRHAEPSSLWVD